MQYWHNPKIAIWSSSKIQQLPLTVPVHLLVEMYPARCHYLSDVVVIFLSSIIVLTPNGQFLDCAAVAFCGQFVTGSQDCQIN